MIPYDLKAAKGDKILPKFTKLVAHIDALRMLSTDPRVTINYTSNGTFVHMVNRPPSIITPFQVRLSGTKFYSVGEGYINGKLPQIKPSQGDLQDIVDPDGIPAPPAKLTEDRPILVCAQVTFNAEFVFKSAEIVLRKQADVPRAGSADFAEKDKTTSALIPLAFMRSNRFIQFVTHNLQVRSYLHNGSRRVLYWPA